MLDDLTPGEIATMVGMFLAVPDGAMVMRQGTLHHLTETPEAISLAEKLNKAGEREDVIEFMEANYG